MTTAVKGLGGSERGERPVAILLAGPNGAGKSKSKRLLVPPSWPFLNADVVAAQLREHGHARAGLDIAAGRFVLGEKRRLVATGTPFCLETTLSGRATAQFVGSWQQAGYEVRLYFLALRCPDLALARVALRVARGGHDIPEDVVRRRWRAGLKAFFEVYAVIVDEWALIDNSDRVGVPVARGGRGTAEVLDPGRWLLLNRLARTL